ncbi:hypothetical protein J2792_002324 [Novosphingobium capsulatum]|uniref:Uncharacterized protein n=1 Tax=Novosphingobium capsulatum TaxID=13688 RepID=A0ABU1MMF5_9SPHN|nr:hypothetical protein [Novosphingobium capsulatum]MDR6511452.1 hypothetical protein [Novosphingobium capsulatum]
MTTLTLGGVVFGRYEIPERIPFGGEQRMNVHRLVGGKKVVDVLGADPVNPEWSGFFIGPDAQARARQIEVLLKAGEPLALTWSERSYTVIIRSFRCEFELAWRIPYSLGVEVVSDNVTPITAGTSLDTTAQVNADATAVATSAASVGNTGLTGAVSSIQSALKSVQDFRTATVSQINAVLTPINQARAIVTGLMQEASTTLAQLGSLASLGGAVPNPVAQFVSGLSLSVNAAQTTGTLADIDARLGRMSLNIGALSAGAKTVTTGSTSLFAVAADQYGDARDWTALAQANGLTDPQVNGITTLVVPAKPGAAATTGGVLNA